MNQDGSQLMSSDANEYESYNTAGEHVTDVSFVTAGAPVDKDYEDEEDDEEFMRSYGGNAALNISVFDDAVSEHAEHIQEDRILRLAEPRFEY